MVGKRVQRTRKPARRERPAGSQGGTTNEHPPWPLRRGFRLRVVASCPIVTAAAATAAAAAAATATARVSSHRDDRCDRLWRPRLWLLQGCRGVPS
jgi:hypothetical protein